MNAQKKRVFVHSNKPHLQNNKNLLSMCCFAYVNAAALVADASISSTIAKASSIV
jgi:hypothetical protein